MIDILEITSIDELKTMRETWDGLLAATPEADFFKTLDWLDVYWAHYGAGQHLHALLVQRDGVPIGVLPLVSRPDDSRFGRLRLLGLAGDSWTSFNGPIGSDREAVLTEGLRYMQGRARDWDYVELRRLDTDDEQDAWAQTAMRKAGMKPDRQVHVETAVLGLDGDWEGYWAGLSGNWRSNCRRCEKRMQAAGRVEYVRYRPRGSAHGEDDPRWDLYEQCMALASRSWQGASTTGTTISDSEIEPFVRDVHIAAARAGGLDVNLLYLDGRPAAFNYNYIYRGCVSSLRLGYDPELASYGVGTVLTARMLRDSFERGDRVFDFLPGSIEAKQKWRPAIKGSYRYSHWPLRNGLLQLLRLKRWLGRHSLRD